MTVTTDSGTDWLLAESLAPDVDGDPLKPLYDGSSRGELVLPFCTHCGAPVDLDQQVCDQCGSSDTDWRSTELAGIVHTATLMHRLEPGLVSATAPYPIVDVELHGGHRLIMTTVDPVSTVPTIGDTVTVGFRCLGGVALPAAHLPAAHPVPAHPVPAQRVPAQPDPASTDPASSEPED
ncbi:Zn-ribbon domain-containing OB-fold protein [Dietzia psychralcaliphila]|uniref:Zn-ribbon domain-containing OB-fold protein n=1 Tax=Dietzia psychralcaliphila TaxID=139021 RepID=UPI0020A6CBF6|nr:zinc-ribbon domain-containing protein [Dietzia psychralcaliphila]